MLILVQKLGYHKEKLGLDSLLMFVIIYESAFMETLTVKASRYLAIVACARRERKRLRLAGYGSSPY